MFAALQRHAERHAMTYLIAFLLGMSASLSAVYDNFYSVGRAEMTAMGWWQVIAVVAKCVAPFAVTVVAYLTKSPMTEPTGGTNPPMAPR